MGKVDQIDQQNAVAREFSSEFLGTKSLWFVKVFLAIIGTMANNGQVAWNMSAEDNPQLLRDNVLIYLFQVILVEKMIKFRKEETASFPIAKNFLPKHTKMHNGNCPKQPFCDKCKLEILFRDDCGL